MDERITESLIIGYDFNPPDNAVLIVGRKTPKQSVTVINTFQGEEAKELYRKLTTPANGVFNE
jgi:hypothetical protein